MPLTPPVCWVVTEGMAGTENQCLGVAGALGLTPVIRRIGLRQPWKALSPHLGFECGLSFTGDRLAPPWPDLMIASGRKAIAACRYVKRRSGGRTITIFLQDPRIDPASFDLVAVPAHDPTRGPNVVVTTAAPNRIDGQRLADARMQWRDLFSPLPSPRIAVTIGGNSRAHSLSADGMTALAGQLRGLAEQGAGLMVTASRRTGARNQSILSDALSGLPSVWMWDGTGDNPYFGMLAWADAIIVTSDSVSMLSEAATTGKPVYMAPLAGGTKRFDRFHQGLIDRGIIRIFDGAMPEPYDYQALDDARRVADAIRALPAFAHFRQIE